MLLENQLKYCLFLFLMVIPSFTFSQDYIPEIRISKQKVKLGEQFTVTLILKHNPESEIVFPDSLYDFSPLELMEKKNYNTITENNISTDSAVYLFTCFEDKNVSFQLPIFEYKNKTKTVFLSPEISIKFESTLPADANNLDVIENTTYQNVIYNFDYIKLGIVLGSVITILGLIFYIFRRKIKTVFENYRLKKLHQTFLTNFEKSKSALKTDSKPEKIEKLIFEWKNHVSKLGIRNFNTLSTREISARFPSSEIKKVLVDTDKAIYGNILEEKLIDSFDILKDFTEKQYQKRKEELLNGK